MKLYQNGVILTMDAEGSRAGAMAVEEMCIRDRSEAPQRPSVLWVCPGWRFGRLPCRFYCLLRVRRRFRSGGLCFYRNRMVP